ncbi:MAG: hypothetical protein ACOCQX_03160 [Candidatus Nanoarchaeia archaeon]
MATEIKQLQKEIQDMRNDIEQIKDMLKEDYELSDYAKRQLKEARETPESDYVDLE